MACVLDRTASTPTGERRGESPVASETETAVQTLSNRKTRGDSQPMGKTRKDQHTKHIKGKNGGGKHAGSKYGVRQERNKARRGYVSW